MIKVILQFLPVRLIKFDHTTKLERAFNHNINRVPVCFAINKDLDHENSIITSELDLQMPKNLSSLIHPSDICNEVMKPADSSFLGPNLEIELVASPTKLYLKFTDVCAKDNSPDGKVDDIADTT